MVNIAYRPDIDGLRAVAVLMVLIYHAGFKIVPGGYVGVDVFFVISGYLITSIIVREMQSSTFTFAKFYIRRMRRILPAFFSVGFVTVAAGYFFLLPVDYKQLTDSFFSASIFASNFFFWLKSGGYFADNATNMPLLHTWSLAVEEQFYVVWPVILLAMHRWLSKNIVVLLTVVAIIMSFVIGEWGARHYPDIAYYMLPARFGELVLGALVALMPKLGHDVKKSTLNLLSLAGVILLLAPALVLSKQSHFPGLNAFWPCLGTALLIVTGRGQALVNDTVLKSKSLVFVGLISYSLYLCHWPIVAYLNYFEVEKSLIVSTAIVIASMLLATVNWRFIERPCRELDLSFLGTWLRLFAAPAALALVVCVLVRANAGLENRFAIKGWKNREGTVSAKECLSASPYNYPEKCLLGRKNTAATFVVWGDSYADSIVQTASEYATQRGLSGLSFIKHSCPSIAGTTRVYTGNNLGRNFVSECEAYTEEVFQYLLANPNIKTVILNSAYNWYLHASTQSGEPILRDKSTGEGHDKIARRLAETANALVKSGKKVIIIMPHFEHNGLRAAIVNYELLHRPGALAVGSGVSARPHKKLDTLLDQYDLDDAVTRIYPYKLLCGGPEDCNFFDASGNLLVSDGHHLSKKAVEKIIYGVADPIF